MARRTSNNRVLPTLDLELAEQELQGGAVAGIDEAGRGPWAGPVVAAAVVLDPDCLPGGVADSKLLDAEVRETAFRAIERCARVGVCIADVARIDRTNILNATLWAMAEALAQLGDVRLALVDGNRLPRVKCEARAIVQGDKTCLSIAAASIVAKVTRDRLMCELAASYPGYGFEQHKGYGTPQHREALTRLGPCDLHRRSFKPVQLALGLAAAG